MSEKEETKLETTAPMPEGWTGNEKPSIKHNPEATPAGISPEAAELNKKLREQIKELRKKLNKIEAPAEKRELPPNNLASPEPVTIETSEGEMEKNWLATGVDITEDDGVVVRVYDPDSKTPEGKFETKPVDLKHLEEWNKASRWKKERKQELKARDMEKKLNITDFDKTKIKVWIRRSPEAGQKQGRLDNGWILVSINFPHGQALVAKNEGGNDKIKTVSLDTLMELNPPMREDRNLEEKKKIMEAEKRK